MPSLLIVYVFCLHFFSIAKSSSQQFYTILLLKEALRCNQYKYVQNVSNALLHYDFYALLQIEK